MQWKMMKEDPGVSSAQAWGCPMHPQEIFKETQASKLGDAPMHRLLSQQSSVHPSPCYNLSLHMLCAMLGTSALYFLVCFSFACYS